jgi:SHS2 domain-containing protein
MGMASIISDAKTRSGASKRGFVIKRDEILCRSLEDLLIIWLEKILYLHESENMLFSFFNKKDRPR